MGCGRFLVASQSELTSGLRSSVRVWLGNTTFRDPLLLPNNLLLLGFLGERMRGGLVDGEGGYWDGDLRSGGRQAPTSLARRISRGQRR